MLAESFFNVLCW